MLENKDRPQKEVKFRETNYLDEEKSGFCFTHTSSSKPQ
jgi:hypothetical protein